MRLKLLSMALLFACHASISFSQESTTSISTPIEISKEGWNKVVQLRNGNTVLLHFENKKGIVVKVFDKDRKEIASKKHLCSVLDINSLNNAYFDGLYDINGEAVLFATQDVDNVRTLIKLRLDGITAALLAEEKAVTSKSFTSRTTSYVLRKHGVEGYYLVNYKNDEAFDSLNVTLMQFNEKHELQKEIPYKLQYADKYDKVDLLGIDLENDGSILITLDARKVLQQNGAFESAMIMASMPLNGNEFVVNTLKLPQSTDLYMTAYNRNPVSGRINIFMQTRSSYSPEDLTLNVVLHDYNESILSFAPNLTGVKQILFDFAKANEYLKQQMKDPNVLLADGLMQDFDTDEKGITTVIAKEHRYRNADYGKKPRKYYGKISVTKYDNNGAEIWGTVIPKSKKDELDESYPMIFGYLSRLSLEGTMSYITGKTSYILFNDIEENYNKTAATPITTFDNYNNTNGVYYSIGADNVLNKQHIFPVVDGEYNHVYPGSEHFNYADNTIAMLMRHKKGKEETFHIAWRKLEN